MRGRARLMAVSGALVVVLLLMYMFMIRPRQGELNDLRAQVEAEESTGNALQLELERLRSLQENAPELEAELAAIRELVPRRDEVANFLFLVQDAADESGVDFVQITNELPKPPPEGASLAEVRVAINAGGGFFAIQDFLRRLYDLDRALRIDLVTMGGAPDEAGDGTTITLDITARIFFELPAGGGNPAPAAPGTTVPDPAISPPAEGVSPAPETSPNDQPAS